MNRNDFPILSRSVNGQPLTYLDNGASTQKPQAVIDAILSYYTRSNANVHRGVHTLSQEATDLFEGARDICAAFIGATRQETIFTRGTTEAINLVAYAWGMHNLRAGDTVVITAMEHHSNIVPWQLVTQATGSTLRVIPMTEQGELVENWRDSITADVKFVGCVHASNALGTINPIAEIIQASKEVGAVTLIDAAQSIAHLSVDVRDLDCDFLAYSGHKLYGPTGIGVLYGRESVLNEMAPFQGGGDMIRSVSFEKTEYNDLPYKFEAGTPNIAGAVGLGAAINYVQSIGLSAIEQYEKTLLEYGRSALQEIDPLRIYGDADKRCGVISFNIDGIHAHDVGTILDEMGIAIRAGHHCAQPVMDFFGIPATARASFGLYNTTEDVDRLVQGLHKCIRLFG